MDVEEPGSSSDDLLPWRGNARVDEATRSEALAHPRAFPVETAKVDRLIVISKSVCRLAAALLSLWPRFDLEGRRLVRTATQEREPGELAPPHQWV